MNRIHEIGRALPSPPSVACTGRAGPGGFVSSQTPPAPAERNEPGAASGLFGGCVMEHFRMSDRTAIAFSGGRTSAFMLYKILEAHGGKLPADVLVCFQNTGREMPATLDFVRDCGAAWGVHIHWMEYRHTLGVGPSFDIVSHNSASREGEPFEQLLRAKSYLPNPVSRFCTIELKIRTQKRFLRSLGWTHWTNAVGLRADEPKRVERATDHERTKKDRWHNICPLSEASIQEHDVFAFWKKQPFDLQLKGRWEGNCDGCFLKNRGAISRMMRDYPGRMHWWQNQEAVERGAGRGAQFRADREGYATMMRVTQDQGIIDWDLEDSLPCAAAGCGI
jgi:3'-phosphoadenosine 5'-phosphosulfate sulfotransferase (PAPS reductase)/FAD synthetase